MKFILDKRSCDFVAVKFFATQKVVEILIIAATCPTGANFTFRKAENLI